MGVCKIKIKIVFLVFFIISNLFAQTWQPKALDGQIINVFCLSPNGISGNNLFAGTYKGVFLSTDDGVSWMQAGLANLRVNTLVIIPSGVGTAKLFAGTATGVYLSTDNGSNWVQINNGLTNTNVNALIVCPNQNGGTNLLAGTNIGVYLSSNNGSNWSITNLSDEYILAFTVSGTNLYAASGTMGQGVYLSTDYGATWTHQSNTGFPGTGICSLTSGPNGAGGTNLFAGTVNYGICLSTNGGSSWVQVGPTTTTVMSLVQYPNGAGGTNILAGSAGGGVFISTNNGSNWKQVNNGLMSNPNVLAMIVDGYNVFAGSSTKLYMISLAALSVPTTTNSATDINSDSATLNAVVNPGGSSSTVQFDYGITSSYGNTVTASQSPITGFSDVSVSATITGLTPNTTYHYRVKAISGVGSSYGDDATFKTSLTAQSWAATNGPNAGQIFALVVNSLGYIFAGTNGYGVYLSTNNGAGWTQVSNGLTNNSIHALVINSSGYIFAGTDAGVFLSTNNGSNWASVNNGLGINTINALAVATNGYIFAGSSNSGVYLSTNNGSNWTQVSSGLTNNNIHALAINSSGNIFAGTVGGGIYLSTNNGANWTQVNNGLTVTTVWSLAVNASNHIIAGTYGGGIFLSTNNGTSWTNRNSGMPNSPDVYSLTINSTDYIFAGLGYLNLGVYISRDNGNSWTLSGLPINNVSSLAVNSSGYIFAGTNEGLVYSSSNFTSKVTIPSPPILATPANGSEGVSVTPTLLWNSSYGAINYRIQLSWDSTFALTVYDTSGIGAASINVSGLNNGTKYYWRVKASNPAGISEWSNAWHFATIIIKAIMVSTSNSNIGQTTATLNSTVNANGSPTSVKFDYGTTTSYGLTVSAGNLYTGNSDVKLSVNIANLIPNTLYHFRCEATNYAGTTYGPDLTFTTLKVLQLSPVALTLSATNVSSTSSTLNGLVNANGSSTTVQFEYGTTTSYGNTITAAESPITGTSNVSVSANLTGLTQFTLYHFRVKATNSSGTNYGEDFVFTTYSIPTAPAATTLSASGITANSGTLNGIVNANNLSSSVQFEYGTTTGYGLTATASQSPVTGSSNTNVSVNLTGLTSNTLYHFRVKATNTVGTKYGADSTLTTLARSITWQATNGPFPYKEILSLANSGSYIFAGTNGNGVYLTTDNGTTWVQKYNGLSNGIVRTLAVNSSGYIFAGTDGGVNISSNNGTNWTKLINGIGTDTLVQALSIDLSGNIIEGTATNGIFRSTDSGTNWTQINNGLSTINVHSLAVSSGYNLYAGTVGGGIFRSTNGGLSWSPLNNGISTTTIWSLAINSTGTIFAGTYGGGVFRSTDNGLSWTSQNDGLPNSPDVYSLTINSAGTIFAGLGSPTPGVYVSTDNGNSWSQSGLPNNNVSALAVSSTGYVYAGTYEAGVYRTSSPTAVAAIPLPPILISPASGSTGIPEEPLLKWNPSSGAANYRIQLCADSTFSTNVLDVDRLADSAIFGGFCGFGLKYYWRVNAANSNGASAWSDVWNFTTVPLNKNAITNSASNITPTAATLNGTVIPQGISTYVGFWYGLTSASENIMVKAIQSPLSGNSSQRVSANITGLTPGTLYHFSIFTQSDLGEIRGQDSTFTTPGILQLPPVALTLSAANVGSTSAILEGKINPNGLSTTWQFDYGTTTSYGTNTPPFAFVSDTAKTWSYTLNNLTPNTIYHYRIEAKNSAGTIYGPDSTFTTLSPNQGWQKTNAPFSVAQAFVEYPDGKGGINLFAGTNKGVLLSTDYGSSWTKVNNGITDTTDVTSLAIIANDSISTTLFAGTRTNGIYRSTDNGSSWSLANNGLTNKYVQTLLVIGNNILAGTGYNGNIFLSTNLGANWTKEDNGIATSLIYTLASVSSGISGTSNLFAGTYQGVFRSTNNGLTWAQSGLTSSEGVYAIKPYSNITGGTNILAGTNIGGAYLSTDNGSTWEHINGLAEPVINAFAISSNGPGSTNIFASSFYSVFLSTDNGSSWAELNGGLYNSGVAALTVCGNNLLAGVNGGIFCSSIASLINKTTLITSSATNIAQTTATLNGFINPNNLSTTAQFEYGTTTSYGSTATASQSPVTGNANINVSANIAGLNSNTLYHFRVRATNSAGTFYGSDMTFMTSIEYPASISLSKSYTFNDPTKTTSFKLIGLPGNLSSQLTQFITGTAKQDWDAYYDNGDTANYLKEFDNTSVFQFKPGYGYWVISKNAISISQSVNTVSLNSDNSYSIPLHNGWNIISNPFDKSVVWDSIIAANSLSSNTALYGWNASWTTSGSFEPYQGYYFYNQRNLTSLKIPYNPNGTAGKVIGKAGVFAWTGGTNSLKLSLKADDNSQSTVYISIDSASSNDFDVNDMLAPPGDFEDAGITLRNEKLSISYKNLLKESRPLNGNGQAFDLIITNKQKEKISLKIEGVNNFKVNEVYLLDLYNQKLFNLKEKDNVDLTALTKSNYQILIGNAGFIKAAEKAILPVEYKLFQNYPNPFNPVTTIEYSIPQTSLVTIKVYNILGKEVATLINEQKTAGIYRTSFAASGIYASGIYFYRIQAGSYIDTKKFVLLK